MTTTSFSDNLTLALPHELTLDETIASMNEAAGKTARRQLARKGKKTMDDQDGPRPPSKRGLSYQQPEATSASASSTGNERQLSRLRPKASAAQHHQYNRDNPFALPEEEGPLPGTAVSRSQKPARKAVRNLVRQAADPSSPLKGQGIISMSTDGVDLGDRPERTRKVGGRTKVVVEVPATAKTHIPAKGHAAPEQGARRLWRKAITRSSGSVAPTEQQPAGDIKEQAGAFGTDQGDENENGNESYGTSQETENGKGQTAGPTTQQTQTAAGQAARQAQARREERPIEILKQRLETFKTTGHRDQEGDQNEKARDLYELIIPELVFLLRSAVKAQSLLGDPVFTAWKELIALMKLVVQAADMAYRWRPQPSGLSKDIKSCVFLIQKSLEKLGRRMGERIYLDEQARLSYADQHRLNEEARTRHEKLVRRYKPAWEGATTTGVRASTLSSSSQDLLSQAANTELPRRHATPIDIDDIDDDFG
ncbi:hypothetical protein DV737_g1200, partial [Chaetothyriales sp. CBS 132003]